MGIKLQREKPRILLISLLYKLIKVPFVPDKFKLELFLNLEWIFERLAHEMSFKFYSPQQHPLRKHAKPFILSLIKENHVVLDLGCNEGYISNIVSEKAEQVVGVDHNKAAIEIAKHRHQKSNLTFVHSEAIDYLKNTSHRFDVLIISHLLEHLDDPIDLLLQLKNHFSYIYIEVPDFNRTYLNCFREDFNMNLIFTDDDHIFEFDRYELKALLNKCGLTVVESEYIFGIQRMWCKVNSV
jgi:SAM-dependent methyltransferase